MDGTVFSDVERDLDFFIVADRYHIQPLKKNNNHSWISILESDQKGFNEELAAASKSSSLNMKSGICVVF